MMTMPLDTVKKHLQVLFFKLLQSLACDPASGAGHARSSRRLALALLLHGTPLKFPLPKEEAPSKRGKLEHLLE
jgi:hypothetical protein